MIERVDAEVAKWAAANVTARHVPALEAITHLGGTKVAVTAGLVAASLARARVGSWKPALRLAAVIGGQNLVHNAIKRLTDRERPDGPHHSVFSGTSFPSGHTTTAAAGWPAVSRAVIGRIHPVTFAIGPAVGLTRILLGVHWLSDVTAGLLLGWGWLGAVRAVERVWATR